MRMTFFLFACLVFSGCITQKVVPLKGKYPQPPLVYNTESSFDKVWEKTVDFFAQNGIPIRIIDRSSGLIISDKTKLSWSFEDKKGVIIKNDAFVVIPSITNGDTFKPWKPDMVTGEWNIRIKATSTGSSINVNLYNVQATFGRAYYSTYTHSVIEPVKLDGKTTGNFEKQLSDLVR